MELTQEKLKDLEAKFEKFKTNLVNTQSQSLKEKVAFLDKYTPNPAFQYWALMYLERENNLTHTQNLASEIWDLRDQISELLGRGNEVIQERDELQAYVKEHCPEFKSQLKWVYSIPEEPDSPPNYFPAESKEIAYRAKARFKKMFEREFAESPEIAEMIIRQMDVTIWHGADEEFEELKKESFYDEAWFKEPMYQCKNIEQMEKVFKYDEIVHCYNGDQELITDDYEEAKRFYGVV